MSDEIFPVHLIDQAAIVRSSIINYTFHYDSVLDANRLRDTLLELIQIGDWRKLGGRLRLNVSAQSLCGFDSSSLFLTRPQPQGKGLLEIHVPRHFSPARPAIRFSHVNFPFDINSHPTASKLPRETGSTPSLYDGCRSFRSFGQPSTLPNNIKHYLTTDEPLLCLRVTSFTNSTLVAITFPHSITDAMGTADILKAWSSVLRGESVKSVLGARDDVLAGTGTKFDEKAKGKFVFEDHQARGLGLLSFLMRHTWDVLTRTNITARHIYLPASIIAYLRRRAEDDLRLASGNDKTPFISDGDIITAWGSKMVFSTTRNSGAIYNVFDMRSRLGGTFRSDVVYLQNAILPSVSILSSQEAQESVGRIALRIRQSVVEQTTETQVRRLMRIARGWFASLGSMPLFAGWDTRVVACTNWTKARFFEAPDFQPAVIKHHGEKEAKGKPVMVMGTTTSVNDNPRDTFIINGKGQLGNYWVHAYLREETWRLIELELENMTSNH